MLYGIKSFVIEGIKSQVDLIAEAFEILENVHKMGTCIKFFKYILASNIHHYEYLFLNHVSTFSLKAQYLTKEARKK